jgi:hypothetical protein
MLFSALHDIPWRDLSSAEWQWIPGLIVLIVVGLIVNRLRRPKRPDRAGRAPMLFKPAPSGVPRMEAAPPSVYRSAVHLQTLAELSFFKTLSGLIEPEFRVFSKVRLADLVHPNFPVRSSEWWTAFNQTARKHIDFVICDAREGKILGVIELDDSSHSRCDANRGDAVKDHVLGSAGIPFVRIRCSRTYDPEILRTQLTPVLGTKSTGGLPQAA